VGNSTDRKNRGIKKRKSNDISRTGINSGVQRRRRGIRNGKSANNQNRQLGLRWEESQNSFLQIKGWIRAAGMKGESWLRRGGAKNIGVRYAIPLKKRLVVDY